MKRSTIWSAVGLALVLSWTSVATARGGGRAGGHGTSLSPHWLEGWVVSVDPQQRSFEVGVNDRQAASTETKRLTVAPNAHIIRDGLNVPFNELKPGDQVRVAFLSDDFSRSHPWQIEARSPWGPETPWDVTYGD
jgi:hypothetical protein